MCPGEIMPSGSYRISIIPFVSHNMQYEQSCLILVPHSPNLVLRRRMKLRIDNLTAADRHAEVSLFLVTSMHGMFASPLIVVMVANLHSGEEEDGSRDPVRCVLYGPFCVEFEKLAHWSYHRHVERRHMPSHLHFGPICLDFTTSCCILHSLAHGTRPSAQPQCSPTEHHDLSRGGEVKPTQ